MKPLIIWDWNGTLLDDMGACIAAMNAMIEQRGLRPLNLASYREAFTFPVIDYYRAIGFDLSREPFADLAVEYIRRYRETEKAAPLQPGAEEALRRLAGAGCRQIVLSAMETASLKKQIDARGVLGYFDQVIGADNIQAHGKIDYARDYFRNRAGVDPSAAVLIGDTDHDFEVAQALGCRCVLVKNGHQNLGRFRFDAGTDLIEGLGQLGKAGL